MSNVFTNPADLTAAILEVVNPGPIMVPTMREQLTELLQPGRQVCFRTESGSLYQLTIFTSKPIVLHKVVHGGPGGMKEVAKGELIPVHDSKRGVAGIRMEEPSGRTYTTSAIVKAWLAYDALAGKSYNEPS